MPIDSILITFFMFILVKKTTMERVSFEDSLLMYYKKYLQRLEKFTSATSKGQRKLSRENAHLAEVATKCLSELLTTHPYFNFSQNIAQLLVYLLNSNNTIIRTNVHTTFKQIFTEDKKFELTLFVSYCTKLCNFCIRKSLIFVFVFNFHL